MSYNCSQSDIELSREAIYLDITYPQRRCAYQLQDTTIKTTKTTNPSALSPVLPRRHPRHHQFRSQTQRRIRCQNFVNAVPYPGLLSIRY